MTVITIRPAPLPTLVDYKVAIERLLDAKAQERRYDSAVSIATYAGSTNTAWSAEAAAFIAWRDAVWFHTYSEMQKVESGQRVQPSVDELLAELPSMTWPN